MAAPQSPHAMVRPPTQLGVQTPGLPPQSTQVAALVSPRPQHSGNINVATPRLPMPAPPSSSQTTPQLPGASSATLAGQTRSTASVAPPPQTLNHTGHVDAPTQAVMTQGQAQAYRQHQLLQVQGKAGTQSPAMTPSPSPMPSTAGILATPRMITPAVQPAQQTPPTEESFNDAEMQPRLVSTTISAPRRSISADPTSRRVSLAPDPPREIPPPENKVRSRLSILATPRERYAPSQPKPNRRQSNVHGNFLVNTVDTFFASSLRRPSINLNSKTKMLMRAPPASTFEHVTVGETYTGAARRGTVRVSQEDMEAFKWMYNNRRG